MLDIRDRQALPRERALADGLKDVIAELRLVDVSDYVAYLRLEQHGNLDDIVASASELFLKPGVLRFAHAGEVHVGWARSPVVQLAMEFAHDDLTVHFHLEMGAAAAGIDITYLDAGEAAPVETAQAQTDRLRSAIAAARLDTRQVAYAS